MSLTRVQIGTEARIVVFRALPGLGDFLCVVPALRAVRAAVPGASVTLVGLERTRSLVERFGAYVDELIDFPGYPGLPEREPDIARWPSFLAAIQGRRFDLALQFHGDGRVVNPLVELFGARRTAGVFASGAHCPDPDTFVADAAGTPEPERWLGVIDRLGLGRGDPALEFPITQGDEAEFGALPDGALLRGTPYVVVHPGAEAPARRWASAAFAAAADRLADRGLAIALTGTAGEAQVTRAVAGAMRAPVIDLTGRTSLGSLAVLVRDAALVLTNDTGVSHLAAAVRAPSVVIFTATDPARWAPADPTRHRAVQVPSAGVGDVLAAADLLLAHEAVGAA